MLWKIEPRSLMVRKRTVDEFHRRFCLDVFLCFLFLVMASLGVAWYSRLPLVLCSALLSGCSAFWAIYFETLVAWVAGFKVPGCFLFQGPQCWSVLDLKMTFVSRSVNPKYVGQKLTPRASVSTHKAETIEKGPTRVSYSF